jgi:hypothetical protein
MVSIPQKDLWPGYEGEEKDLLEIEIFEPWLEHLKIANNE